MENISLKSLVSQKTINEAEIDRILQEDFDREVSILQENRNVYSNAIKRGVLTEAEVDEGILDTGWDAIKRAGAEIKRQYDISKRNGDAAALARWEKKDAELKATAEKKAAAESAADATGTTGEKTKDAPKDRAEDEKLADTYLSKTPPRPITQSPDTASAGEDAPDATTGAVTSDKKQGDSPAANKPNIAASTAYQICGEIVKSLIKNTPRNDRYMTLLKQAVTKNDSKTILAYFNKLQSGTTAKIKSEILKRYKQETGKSSKNYTGVIRKYIKTAKLDVASALALIDIVRGLAKMDIKDRATIIFRAFNNNGIGKRQPAVKKPAAPTKPPAPVAPAPVASPAMTVDAKPFVSAPVPQVTTTNQSVQNLPIGSDTAFNYPEAIAKHGDMNTQYSNAIKTDPAKFSEFLDAQGQDPNGKTPQWKYWRDMTDSALSKSGQQATPARLKETKPFTRSTSIPNMFRLS